MQAYLMSGELQLVHLLLCHLLLIDLLLLHHVLRHLQLLVLLRNVGLIIFRDFSGIFRDFRVASILCCVDIEEDCTAPCRKTCLGKSVLM